MEPDFKKIDELLKKGANIDYLTEYNENVLFKVSVWKAILFNCKIFEFFIKAVEFKTIDLVKHFLVKKIKVDQVNKFNCNILHVAARTDNVEIFQLITDYLKGLCYF